MKKLRIIYALLFSMALFLAIPLNAVADFGPKPSVSISFRNAGGQTCYSAILARGSFQPSLGELVTEDAYSTEWFGELTPQEQEAVRAFADYAGRSAPDGYALFNRLWDVSRENVEMTYLPPDDFIVLAYFPDSGRVIASDICRTYVFNSYFTADLSRSDSLLYIKQSYNVGIWLLEFAARVLITIAVELVVALRGGQPRYSGAAEHDTGSGQYPVRLPAIPVRVHVRGIDRGNVRGCFLQRVHREVQPSKWQGAGGFLRHLRESGVVLRRSGFFGEFHGADVTFIPCGCH